VALFFTGERIGHALYRVGHSRAKATLFDFLIVKRTLKIKGVASVAIVQSDQAYISALDELALSGSAVAPGPYLNPFSITDNRSGYRSAKFKSNGTGSTISNNPWRPIFALSSDSPRQASLEAGYENHLEPMFLKGGSNDQKPSLDETAIWYYRGRDVEALTLTAVDPEDRLAQLRHQFVTDLGITQPEIDHLFDATPASIAAEDFSDTIADPASYLPNVAVASAVTPAAISGVCSADLVNALSAKPFVILTGPSGTGKTRAALKMAEGLQRIVADGIKGSLFQLVPVGPDWTSPKRLLGYRTPFGETRAKADGTETNDSYEITQTIRLILRATHPSATGIPYFLIFDEMNLSHVERYFAPFLSLMEASNILDEDEAAPLIDLQSLVTISDLLQQEDATSPEAEAAKLLVDNGRNLRFPSNLFFIGTVNVDETTYMFSPKVLDRAHVLEIDSEKPSDYINGSAASEAGGVIAIEIALEMLRGGIDDREGQRHEVANPGLILDRLVSELGFSDAQAAIVRDGTTRALDGCYELLGPIGFPFGYRSVKEAFVYIFTWIRGQTLQGVDTSAIMDAWPIALDKAVLQKILPKIHGSKRLLGDSLKATAAFLGGGHANTNPAARYALALGKTIEILPVAALALPENKALNLSKLKLEAMHGKLSATGYVSSVS